MRASLVIICCALLAACAREAPLPEGQIARFDADDYRGRTVVINYWAQWCKPCVEEIPELNRLAHRDARLVVLGVNFDGATGAELAAQARALGIEFSLVLEDPGPGLGTPRPEGLPTTLVIGPEGRIIATLLGPQTEESVARAAGL